MFRHVVMLTLNEGTSAEAVESILDGMRALPAQIPQIVSYTCGRDAGVSEGNADVVAVADFHNVEGYVAYRDHPAHAALIRDRIRPVLASRSALQHEY